MSALLETLSRETDSKHCWSGRVDWRVPPPIAEPVLLAHNDHAAIVFAAGVLEERVTVELAQLVLSAARRPENRLVYVALATQGGRLAGLGAAAEMLSEARRQATIVAYLEYAAFGPALWLAYQSDLVFSHPLTSFGWLECFSDRGDFDSDATMGMVEDLAALRPNVARFTWARLVQSEATAEQAEALGIVELTSSVFELSGIDGNQPVSVR